MSNRQVVSVYERNGKQVMMNSTRSSGCAFAAALGLMILLASCTDQIGNPPSVVPSPDGAGKLIYSNSDLLFAKTPIEILMTDSSGLAPEELFPWAVRSEAGTAMSNPTVSEAYITSVGKGRFVWMLKDTATVPFEDTGGVPGPVYRFYVTDVEANSSSCVDSFTQESYGGNVFISPDGSHIAVIDLGGSSAHPTAPTMVVYALAAVHDGLTPIDPHVITADEVSNACFSPDGSRIAYYDKTGASTALEIAKVDGTGKQTLAIVDETNIPKGFGPSIAWSPAGDLIAFQSGGSLQVIHTDGSVQSEVDADGIMPEWSPDGKTLAYVTSVGVMDRQRIVLTSDLGDTKHDLVVKDNIPRLGPKWSPDGQKILCFTGGPGLGVSASLEVIDVAKGTTRVLASPGCLGMWLR